ncbi:MAG: hypothetical protein QP798_11640 [Staphylococcus simulans]|nr:hypothetical protein [Staphylococcus simulans]MDK7927915.1 hypothetical protein [Staphylococcus simulans]MDK8316577.1 hypothetical protein [Staphylococcus simulans]
MVYTILYYQRLNIIISSYRINKDNGVSYGNINDIRRGERKVENLTLKNAGKLYKYTKIHLK